MELAVLVGIVLVGIGICNVVLGTYLLARPSRAQPSLVQLPESRADTIPSALRRVGVPGTDLVEIVGNTVLNSPEADGILVTESESKAPV